MLAEAYTSTFTLRSAHSRLGMARGLRVLGFLTLIYASLSVHGCAAVRPISDAHRSAAQELFVPINGSFGSLEETYEALRTFQILGVEKKIDIIDNTCLFIVDKLGSSSSTPKELFHALRVNSILRCHTEARTFKDISSKLQSTVKDASSLMDLYYSIGSLLHIKKHGFDVTLSNAGGIFSSIKALGQSDGRWLYDSDGAVSSTHASGIALETFAGVILLANSEVDQSKIGTVKNDIMKLFDAIKSYDDGSLYFDEKHVDTGDYKSPLATTASVVRGVTSFAEVASGKLNIPGDKVLGLANFFLSTGILGSRKDFFNQIESLSCLENNRFFIPLILSLPTNVLSLTKKDDLKVEVTTVLGSAAPPLTVNLVQAFRSDSKGTPVIENQELHFDPENAIHYLDIAPLKIDVGKYTLVFEISLHASENINIYVTRERIRTSAIVTGSIKIDKAEIAVLGSDSGSVEAAQKLDLSRDNTVFLSANHLQKLSLSFQLTTPLGRTFKPHQVFLKLRHETKIEHIFILEISGRQFKIVLDFLDLVKKFYYLSGRYDIELTTGDAAMENSFLLALGHVELDLPEPPEKATLPQLIDASSRFGPKQEISHIFRSPEKRPSEKLSIVFLALICLPLIGFFKGLISLRVDLKSFPSSGAPAAFSVLFHGSIAAVLLLYVLFWSKLDLFTTLKALGFLGVLLVFVGHRTLSHLAKTSSKEKSA